MSTKENLQAQNHSFTRAYFESEEQRLWELKKKLEPWAKEMGGRNGVKNIPASDAAAPFADHIEKQIYLEVQQGFAKTMAVLRQAYNYKRNKRSAGEKPLFGLAQKKQVSADVERASEMAAIKEEIAFLLGQEKELAQKITDQKAEIKGLVAKIGGTPYRRNWIQRVIYIPTVILLSCGELPINIDALVSTTNTMPLLFVYFTACFLCLIGAGIAHYLGRGIAMRNSRDEQATKREKVFFSQENMEVRIPVLLGTILLSMIFCLRWELSDWYLSFINVGFIGLATLASYFHTNTTPFGKNYESKMDDLEYLQKQKRGLQKKLVQLKKSLARLELIEKEEVQKQKENPISDDLDNILVSQQEYHEQYKALYHFLIEAYRSANTTARMECEVPLVPFWEEEPTYLPSLTFNPITTNNQNY